MTILGVAQVFEGHTFRPFSVNKETSELSQTFETPNYAVKVNYLTTNGKVKMVEIFVIN